MDVEAIRRQLERLGVEAWLLYDFQGLNPIARDLAALRERMLTRRWFCLIRQLGEPVWLVSRVEQRQFEDVPGEVRTCLSWASLQSGVRDLLSGVSRVAMEYVPDGSIPYVSRVDAGTVEMVRACGVEVVSSADLVQACLARWSPAALATHLEAAGHLTAARERAFEFIARQVAAGRRITEYDVQREIMDYFDLHDLVTSDPPVVAAGRNTGDPHYQPTSSSCAVIQEGDLVLIDMWAKTGAPESVYADITWMAYVGREVPGEFSHIFGIVAHARDAAVQFVQSAVAAGDVIRGHQVDDVARAVVAEAGYGDRFIHRTGHNIGTDDHGSGVNFDNLETRDERIVISDIACSIEPGVYLDLFGMRSEVNIHIGERRAEVTTVPVQRRIVPLLRQT